MRRIRRVALSQTAVDKLAELTSEVLGATNPREKAQKLWNSKPKAVFREVHRKLEEMASGRSRCMYCEDSHGTDIDHFRPKADYPQSTFEWRNYLLACSHCNSNLKRNEFPVDAEGAPLLLDPSTDEPADHLSFSPSTGEFVPIGPKGPESIRVFGLNDHTSPRRLPTGRRQALIVLVALLQAYDREVDTNPAKASEIRATVKEHPFSAVLHWLVRIAQASTGPDVLGADVVALVNSHHVDRWL